jgi:hypothetical protein
LAELIVTCIFALALAALVFFAIYKINPDSLKISANVTKLITLSLELSSHSKGEHERG